MDFKFVLDEKNIAFNILERKMHDETIEVANYRNILGNDIGYQKIIGKELIETSIYLQDEGINKLIKEFISTKEFESIHLSYPKTSKEEIAIKLLNNMIVNDDENLDKEKDILWDKYRDSYKKIFNISFPIMNCYLQDIDITKTINNFINTKTFKKLYSETKEYKNMVEKSWQQNKANINTYLNDVLKTKIGKEIPVYIQHPNTCNGYNLDNKIIWGHYKGIEDLNYNLCYLVHEGLHTLIPFTKQDTDISISIKHSIIELISDYELYSKLTNKSTIKEGHPYLEEYKKILYPYWLNYIGLSEAEQVERAIKDNVKNIQIVNNPKLKDQNIYEFIECCINNYHKLEEQKIKIL